MIPDNHYQKMVLYNHNHQMIVTSLIAIIKKWSLVIAIIKIWSLVITIIIIIKLVITISRLSLVINIMRSSVLSENHFSSSSLEASISSSLSTWLGMTSSVNKHWAGLSPASMLSLTNNKIKAIVSDFWKLFQKQKKTSNSVINYSRYVTLFCVYVFEICPEIIWTIIWIEL